MGMMRLCLTACLFQLLLCFRALTTGLVIQSEPAVSDGFIKTWLNRTVSLTCHSEGGSLELQWLRNGALVSLGEGNKLDRSNLCVTPITQKDQGAIFTCQLKGNASVNASLTLDVIYPPLLSGMKEMSVEQEAQLALECDVQANPPVRVSWEQDGTLLDLSQGGFTVTNDGKKSWLVVGHVERSVHQGIYTCNTSSTEHGTHSKSFQVTITDKTLKFPLMPVIAGVVVVFFTVVLAIVSRWEKIARCCK